MLKTYSLTKDTLLFFRPNQISRNFLSVVYVYW